MRANECVRACVCGWVPNKPGPSLSSRMHLCLAKQFELEKQVNDAWLDQYQKASDAADEADGGASAAKKAQAAKKAAEKAPEVLDPIKVKRDIVAMMKPGENVLKTIKRLGDAKKDQPQSAAGIRKLLTKKNIRRKERERLQGECLHPHASCADLYVHWCFESLSRLPALFDFV